MQSCGNKHNDKLYPINQQKISFCHTPVPYLAIFEQGGSADIFSLITGPWGKR